MAIGTAGYTAMLSVMAIERAGIVPARGSVVVTGAAGGVGSVAIALLAKLGYRSWRRPVVRPKPIISKDWARPRSSSARN